MCMFFHLCKPFYTDRIASRCKFYLKFISLLVIILNDDREYKTRSSSLGPHGTSHVLMEFYRGEQGCGFFTMNISKLIFYMDQSFNREAPSMMVFCYN